MSAQSRELAIAIGAAARKDVPPWPDQCPECPAVMTFGVIEPPAAHLEAEVFRQCICGTRVIFDGRAMRTLRAPCQLP